MSDHPPPDRQNTELPSDTKPKAAPADDNANDDDNDYEDGMGEVEMSDPDPKPDSPKQVPETTAAERAAWHGYLLADDPSIPLPKCVTESDDLARAAYTNIKSAEYCDAPEVLELKADLLIRMWTSAKFPMIYAGAGISTSSGIWDYASNASGSKVQPKKRKLTHSFILSLKPTPAHRVITQMEKRGYVWGWLQQNHDGLAQKAGFPGDKVNELHGCWLNSADNPIIKMSGTLRSDLYEWKCKMHEKADFVFALGTSFSGLNADSCAENCATTHIKSGGKVGQGLAILTIQKTPYDRLAALRIFSRIDDFMLIVAKKMSMLPLDSRVYAYSAPRKPVGPPKDSDWDNEVARKKELAAKAMEAQATAQARVSAPSAAARQQRGQSPGRSPPQTKSPASKSPASKSPGSKSPASTGVTPPPKPAPKK